MRHRNVMFAPEIADRLGYSADYFNRHIDRFVVELRMPTWQPSLGRRRWDRALMEAWLNGRVLPAAANDTAPLAPDAAAWRDALAHEYGSPR